MSQDSKYRQNVCGLIFFSKHLLLCERADYINSWQFPQGGIEENESLISAFFREMKEELDFEKPDFETIDISKTSYKYDFPFLSKKSADKFLGQEQYFVKAELKSNKLPKLNYEFRSFIWLNPKFFPLMNFSFFKKEVAVQAMQDFLII